MRIGSNVKSGDLIILTLMLSLPARRATVHAAGPRRRATKLGGTARVARGRKIQSGGKLSGSVKALVKRRELKAQRKRAALESPVTEPETPVASNEVKVKLLNLGRGRIGAPRPRRQAFHELRNKRTGELRKFKVFAEDQLKTFADSKLLKKRLIPFQADDDCDSDPELIDGAADAAVKDLKKAVRAYMGGKPLSHE